jgi:hypothetical protein
MNRYPSHWGFEETDYWLGENFIMDRARIAHGLNKPIILEEIGSEVTHIQNIENIVPI